MKDGEELIYTPPNTKPKKRKRKDRVTWFNPPYNKNTKTPVAKEVLKLISKHFPKGSELGKLFNRSTVKVSYCTTRNIAQHISAHNKKILAEKKNPKPKTCN